MSNTPTPSSTSAPCISLDFNCRIGGDELCIMAGPCAVEGENIFQIAAAVKDAGAQILRGGAFKPRTNPHTFQGIGLAGIDLLVEAGHGLGMPVVSELMDVRLLETFLDKGVDMLQIGARNCQNFTLLTEVGRAGAPVLLKRSAGITVDEYLSAAEYILEEGNGQVILCERGIKSFDTSLRNCFDVMSIPVLKGRSDLLVFCDPSHATGRRDLVEPCALAGVAAGADGLIIETHVDPDRSISDSRQTIGPDSLKAIITKSNSLRGVINA